MKRLWIALALIVAINLASGWALYRIAGITEDLTGRLDQILKAAQQQDQNAQSLTEELLESWRAQEATLERYIHHEALDLITGEMARLPVYAGYGEYSALAAEAARLRELLWHTYEAERPSLGNIF